MPSRELIGWPVGVRRNVKVYSDKYRKNLIGTAFEEWRDPVYFPKHLT